MEKQIIRFDGMNERQIDASLLKNEILRDAIIQIAYASYSNKIKQQIINNGKK